MPARRVPENLVNVVIERAQGFCEYCRCPDSLSTGERFSVDHILAQSRGGASSLENLAYACQGCNGKKGNKLSGFDPLTGGKVRLFNPRRQRWLNHFGWSSDFTLVIGKTLTGRATVATLKLNRLGVVNISARCFVKRMNIRLSNNKIFSERKLWQPEVPLSV